MTETEPVRGTALSDNDSARRPSGTAAAPPVNAGVQKLNILVVEDDVVIGKSLDRGLTEAGHITTWVRDGDKAVEQGTTQRYDVIVLDLMLPGKMGLDALRELRVAGIQTPVLLLTALGSVDERVAGLQAGADDYLVKPFAFSELVARIAAVCRRTSARAAPKLEAGDLTLDLATRRVTREGREIDLTPTEFSLLEYLMRHAGQPVTRKMLCEHLWESDWEGVTNVIEVHINRLRNKVDRNFSRPLILTVRGRGYAIRAV